MRKKLFAIFCSVFFLAFALQQASAIDVYVVELYKQIDGAFTDKSDRELDNVLSKNNSDVNYYLLENYTMKKIRRLVINKDYQFALQSNLVVIDNNLENEEAVEMYSVIAAAIEQQKEIEANEKRRREKEEKQLAAEKEKQRIIAVKEYKSLTDAGGTAIFVASKDERYTATNWKAMFGMANGVFVSDMANNYNSFRYGISGNFKYNYNLNKFVIGIDADADFIMLPFSNNDDTLLANIGLVPQFGFIGLNGDFLFRVGFDALFNINMGDVSTLFGNMFTPVVGIGWDNVWMGDVNFSGNFDYYLGHLAYDNLNSAMKAQINFAIPVAELDKVMVTFNLGIKDTLLVRQEGIENRAGVVLAFGVENVTK